MNTMKNVKWMMVALLWLMAVQSGMSQTYKTITDIQYTTKTDAYAQQRLKLDVYYEEGKSDRPVIVWFHGGGLEAGQKEIPAPLKEKGWVVVGVN